MRIPVVVPQEEDILIAFGTPETTDVDGAPPPLLRLLVKLAT